MTAPTPNSKCFNGNRTAKKMQCNKFYFPQHKICNFPLLTHRTSRTEKEENDLVLIDTESR